MAGGKKMIELKPKNERAAWYKMFHPARPVVVQYRNRTGGDLFVTACFSMSVVNVTILENAAELRSAVRSKAVHPTIRPGLEEWTEDKPLPFHCITHTAPHSFQFLVFDLYKEYLGGNCTLFNKPQVIDNWVLFKNGLHKGQLQRCSSRHDN